MKKITFLAMAASVLCSASAMAQQANNEVKYVEDPAQGYTFNKFKDNWFITGEGGVNLYMSTNDTKMDFGKRLSPAAGLYIGKWFSPIIGLRLGGSFLAAKGVIDNPNAIDARPDEPVGNMYKQRINFFGPQGDVMLNITNWWGGYNPNRKYNFIAYAGAGGYWTLTDYKHQGWKNQHDRLLNVRAGIINSIDLSKQVALSLDIRWTGMDREEMAGNRVSHDMQAYLGLTYKFNKREWTAPVVPVYPEPENCDALRARLAAAEGRIADLEKQLNDCLNRPVEKVVVNNNMPLATIYYPIGVSRLTRKDILIIDAVAHVMKDNSSKHYTLTGWADNYTGSDQINTRLRHNRVNGVLKQLLKAGVPESQLTATINAGNLCDLGEKYMQLDRAVTIVEK